MRLHVFPRQSAVWEFSWIQASSWIIRCLSWKISALHQLWLVCQLHLFLDKNYLSRVTHALVTSQPNPKRKTLCGPALECMLTRMSCCHQVTSVLHELHWFPVVFRAQFKVLVIPYKAQSKGTPNLHWTPTLAIFCQMLNAEL